MDNFNNPNDPYNVGNQSNPYTNPAPSDPYGQPAAPQQVTPADPYGQPQQASSSYTTPQNSLYNPNEDPFGTTTPPPVDPYGQAPLGNMYTPAPQITPQTGYNNYPQYGQPQQPSFMGEDQDKKNANRLCIISLVCYCLPMFLNAIYYATITSRIDYTNIDNYDYSAGSGSMIISVLNFMLFIAAWVLMIVARVKYKNSTFAKVLMWVYIGLFILGIILVVVVIVTCAAAFNSLLNDCPGILFH